MASNTNLNTQRVAGSAGAVRSVSSFARPNNTTAYAVGDAVFEGTAGVIEFRECGASGIIERASLVMEESDTASFVLLVFDQEPTNVADNAAAIGTLDADDYRNLVGLFTFTNASKVHIGTNLELYQSTTPSRPSAYTSSNGRLFGILITNSVFTPIAESVYNLALHIQADQ